MSAACNCCVSLKTYVSDAKDKAQEFADLAGNKLGVVPVEECRRCLEDGIFRRCCDNWYCNDCYYRIGECPSCGANTASAGQKKKEEEAKKVQKHATLGQLVGTYTLKGGYWVFLFGWPFVYFINKMVAYRTLHGFQCEGFFPQCKYELCVSINTEIDNATDFPFYTSKLPTCGSNERCRRMCSKACVFDDRMFSLSHGKLGLDICTDLMNDYVVIMNDDAESRLEVPKNATPLNHGPGLDGSVQGPNVPNSMQLDVNAQYQQAGEYLSSIWNVYAPGNPSIRESAFWGMLINGNPDRICGSVHGDNSLVFTGQLNRYAETVDLNIEYGSVITFGFKFGGYIDGNNEPTHPECREAIRTPVYVKYSTNGGITWTKLSFITVTGGGGYIEEFGESYVTEYMNNVTITIDETHLAATAATRFRWEQVDFQSFRDFWAIDNVTIVARTLSFGWDHENSWESAKEQVNTQLRQAQCCYGSSYCPTWHAEALDPAVCEQFPRWEDHGVGAASLRCTQAELFSLTWAFLAIVGLIWWLLVRRCIAVRRCLGGAPKGKAKWGSFARPGALDEHDEKYAQQYFIWNSKTRENMEVVEFKVARDRKFQRNFLLLGPVITFLMVAGELYQGYARTNVRVDVAQNLQGPKLAQYAPEAFYEYWIETHFELPGWSLALIAALLDLKDTLYIGLHCVGAFSFWKKHTPIKVQIYHHKGNITADDVQRLDRLVVDGDELGAVPIGKITKIETATERYTKQMCFTLLLGSMPWACCMSLLSRWLPDGVGMCWGVLVALKALTGPHFFSKMLFMWPYFFTMIDEYLHVTARRCCRRDCLRLGIGMAVAASALCYPLTILYFWWGNADIFSVVPDYLLGSYFGGVFVTFFCLGSLLGWGRRLPVEPWIYITGGLDDLEPTIVHYTRDDACFTNEEGSCRPLWSQENCIVLAVEDAFNFSEALKGEHLDFDRPEERIVLRPGRRAQIVLDLDFITFCRNEDLLVETVAFDIAKELRTLPVEIILEDFFKANRCVCVVFTVAGASGVESIEEFDTQTIGKTFPEVGRYKKTEELKALLNERMNHPFPTASKAFGYPISPIDRFRVHPVTLRRPMLDGYRIVEGTYKRPKAADEDSDNDSFEERLAEMDAAHDQKEKERLEAREDTDSEDGNGSGRGSPGSDSSPGSPGSPGYGSPGWSGLAGSPGSPGSGSPESLTGAHWNADGHEYPEEVRQMLAEIEASIAPDRPLVCRRPWCLAKYSRDKNRNDACLYHPGEVRTEMRPPTEDELIARLGDNRRESRKDATIMMNGAMLLDPASAGGGNVSRKDDVSELVEHKVWSCCGQPYVDLSKMEHTNPHGHELPVGRHKTHRGEDTMGFKFREHLPCTPCPHF
jgi:hypothetical protein